MPDGPRPAPVRRSGPRRRAAAGLTQSGSSETVRNESYNGALAADASTTFGFQVSGAAPGTPALTCTPS
ncbi:cellulose binding domain-containing protein [Cellulomonas sp. NPDC055163]